MDNTASSFFGRLPIIFDCLFSYRVMSINPVPQPQPEFNSTVEKERLQNVMTFGSDKAPDISTKFPSRSQDELEEGMEVDRFDEVMREIEERQKFLDDMAALGQDKSHRSRIMTEISQV